jgi:16S rRNA (guanine527-N7)-methyltransferase
MDIKECLSQIGVQITDNQEEKFNIYRSFLSECNNWVNLTAITDMQEIAVKHFADSLLGHEIFSCSENGSLIDVGTGAGFPGMPIGICFPGMRLHLLDSSNKKTKFLNQLCDKLRIKANIICARAEEASKKELYRAKFDFAVSRALAPISILLEYCMPYVKLGGVFAAFKGPGDKNEMKNYCAAVKALGGEITGVKTFMLRQIGAERRIIVIKKTNNTSEIYPRANAKILRNPL